MQPTIRNDNFTFSRNMCYCPMFCCCVTYFVTVHTKKYVKEVQGALFCAK